MDVKFPSKNETILEFIQILYQNSRNVRAKSWQKFPSHVSYLTLKSFYKKEKYVYEEFEKKKKIRRRKYE